jgi:hypothetical protein
MLDFTLDPASSILTIRPRVALQKEDFVQLAQAVDPYIESTGDLAGIIIDAPTFPGWDSFGALAAHIRFVRDHHKHVRRIAVVTDAPLATIAPKLASRFVAATIKPFPAGQIDAAQRWIKEPAA